MNWLLRARLVIEQLARQLKNFFEASTALIKVVARACGHEDVNQFSQDDLITFNYDMHRLTGIRYAGVTF